jgi:precorrin-3B synthase
MTIAGASPIFDIILGGSILGGHPFGPCPAAAVPDIAVSLAHVLLDHPGVRRMTDLLTRLGPDEIARRAGLTRSATPPIHRHTDPIGIHSLGRTACLGIGLPFGRISAEDLATLATLATHHGATELRLTPWRAILIPLPNTNAAQALSQSLPPATFIHDPADPRRRIAACVGAPACASATTSTRDDALALTPHVANTTGTGIVLHVSGCDKGCAHPAPAPLTLVARHGRYHLIRNGTAADPGEPATLP